MSHLGSYPGKEVIKAFQRAGWEISRQEMFHGRRPLAAMKHFLRDHREKITERRCQKGG